MFKTVDVSKLQLDSVRSGRSGMKMGNLQMSDGSRITIQTPVMNIAWNTEVRRQEDSGNVSCKLALSFNGMDANDPNDDVANFYKFLEEMDKKVVELVVQKKSELWTKNMDAKKIEGVYHPSIKSSNNEKYAPTFQAKVWTTETNPEADEVNDQFSMDISVYKPNREKIDSSYLKGRCMAAAIVQASYVWVSPMMVGLTWSVKSVVVKPRVEESEFQFQDLDKFGDLDDEPVAKKSRVESPVSFGSDHSSDVDGLENEEL